MLVLSPLQSRDLDSQALVDLFLGLLRLWRASPARPFFPLLAGRHPIVEGMRAPGPWPATSPPLAAALIVGERGLRIRRTGKTSRLNASDMLGNPLCLVGLRFGIRQGCLLSQLAGVHDHKPERRQDDPPVAILHFYTPPDTLAMPLA
jgi:hypothetical protein